MAQSTELIEALRAPRAYPHPVMAVQVVETHISWVLLTGQFAYKIKKPVELGFVDFSTLERRRVACELEVTLNRRLAGDLYVGVVPITADGPRLAGTGHTIEYAVQMRQFDPSHTLDHLIETRDLAPDMFVEFAHRLARFHAGLPGADPAQPYGQPKALAAGARDNLRELAATPFGETHREQLADLASWTASRADELASLMTARKAAGLVRECHGDLHLGNLVAQGERCVAFDCLEFNPDLRWLDVMKEVACLVMDLLAHRRSDLAFTFLNSYLEISGDYAGLETLRFYLVYWALVRSKVCALTGPPSSARGAADPTARAQAYLDLAHELVRPARPRLLLTHGLSGSGKSWLAAALAARLPAVWLRSDVERKRLAALPADARTHAELDQGLYSAAMTRQVYRRCGELAQPALVDGWSVIVDAATLKAWQRATLRAVATELGVPFRILHCDADAGVLEQRVARRQAEAQDVSEAGLDVLHHQQASAEPLSATEHAEALTIATDRPLDWSALLAEIARPTG